MFFWFLIIEIVNYLYILWSYQSYQDTTIELDQNCSLAEWQHFLKSRLETDVDEIMVGFFSY